MNNDGIFAFPHFDAGKVSAEKIIDDLYGFWADDFGLKKVKEVGEPPLVGAATLAPQVMDACVKGEYNICFDVICRRPQDFFHENYQIDRTLLFNQFQVMIDSTLDEAKDLLQDSLVRLGLDLDKIEFVKDDWSNPSIGAGGTGFEIRYNGLEVAQFTHITKYCMTELEKPFYELAYGVERLAMSLSKLKDARIIKFTHHRMYYTEMRMGLFIKNTGTATLLETYKGAILIANGDLQMDTSSEHHTRRSWGQLLIAIDCFNWLLANKALPSPPRDEYQRPTVDVFGEPCPLKKWRGQKGKVRYVISDMEYYINPLRYLARDIYKANLERHKRGE